MKNKKRTYYFIKMFLLLLGSLLFIEGTFRLLTFNTLLGIEIIRIILFSMFISILVSFICSFFKPKVSKTIILVFVFLMGIYTLAQLNFKNFMDSYMSLNAAGEGGLLRVKNEIIQFIMYIRPVYLLCLFPFFILLIFFIINKEYLKKEKTSKLRIASIILSLVSIHLLAMLTLSLNIFQNKNQITTNLELYKEPTLHDLALKQFGPIRFLWRDIVYMISPSKNEPIDIPIIIDPEPIIVEPDYERKIDDNEWIKIIEAEDNPIIKNLHEYYISQPITPKNEMTGRFEGKNLILIMVEAFDMIAIDEKLTPTLYKLSTEGWYFDNYYTPKYSCTTGESEYIALTSIIPSNTVCTPNTYVNNNYSTSIFNLFNQKDYYSTSYHSFTDQYYNRTKLHKNMGSVKFYNRDTLKTKVIWGWPSDLDLMERSMPHFIDQEKYFSFIITAVTHFPYDSDSRVVKDNWKLVKNLPYSDKIKRYMAKAIDLDKSLKYIIDQLEAKGTLDDTVLVLFGDHHPLKMGVSNLNSASSIDRTKDFNVDKLPFIIYNSKEEGKVFSQTASTFDILPTIANLFNLDYDPRHYIGADIFSEQEKTVIFANGSWITDKAMYFSSSNKHKILDNQVGEEYIKQKNQEVKNKFNASKTTLTKDYFKHRFK